MNKERCFLIWRVCSSYAHSGIFYHGRMRVLLLATLAMAFVAEPDGCFLYSGKGNCETCLSSYRENDALCTGANGTRMCSCNSGAYSGACDSGLECVNEVCLEPCSWYDISCFPSCFSLLSKAGARCLTLAWLVQLPPCSRPLDATLFRPLASAVRYIFPTLSFFSFGVCSCGLQNLACYLSCI
jgi:hypothetical protein